MTETRSRRVLLGVTGSTSATKAQSIALALKHVGFDVRVAMTAGAQKFITSLALSSVVETPPYADMWVNPPGVGGEVHIKWAEWADAMIIAPATASCISALWLGQFDSPVTLLAGALHPRKLVIAPAMAREMWDWPSVKRNVNDLAKWGVRFLGPVEGRVASGGIGMRLMEPHAIAQHMNELCVLPTQHT